jgi:hypothetical protein
LKVLLTVAFQALRFKDDKNQGDRLGEIPNLRRDLIDEL